MSKNLLLFSASGDQKRYFEQLGEYVGAIHIHYKQLPFWSGKQVKIPKDEVFQQVQLLERRKRNTRKGQNKAEFYWRLARFLWMWEAKRLFSLYVHWLSERPEQWIGVWNGKKFRQALFVLAAKAVGKKIIYFERGPFPGHSMVECAGVNAASGIPRRGDFYKQFTCELSSVSAEPCSNPRLPQKYVFVPFQVVEDSNIYLHSPHIPSMCTLYAWLYEVAEAMPHITFVCKTHPACPERYDDLTEKHPRIQFVEGCTTRQLIAGAHAVVTINSTVGMEALEANKPLVVLGDAIYDLDGLVLKADSVEMLKNQLGKIEAGWSADQAVREGYLCYLKNHYALPGDAMNNPTPEHFEAVARRIHDIMTLGCKAALHINS